MENLLWVKEWARVRQDEVARLPEDFGVDDCFLKNITKDDFDCAFREIWNMYINIYGDIYEFPETFGMPLYKSEEYEYSTKEGRESRNAPYRPFKLLFNLLISGEIHNEELVVDTAKFKKINDVKNANILFERLRDYGFYFEGLINYKVAKETIYISYTDNQYILAVLKLMADKAHAAGRRDDFFSCHYKLFQEGMNTVSYGYGADIVADKMHTKGEQEFVFVMDNTLSQMGYYAGSRGWNEGPGYAYYAKKSEVKTKGPYHYWMLSWKTKLVLYLRIRNASKCIDYLKQCPDSVKQMFLWSDKGCTNRIKGTCKMGQEYSVDGNTYWRCGCCNAPFHVNPIKEDIVHYLKLVELGLKK